MKKSRIFIINLILSILLLVSMCLGIMFGSVSIPLKEVLNGIFGDSDNAISAIISTVRVPRVLAGLLAGAGLSVSGVILQAIMDNPLAGPNIIGVNAGAGFFVLLILAIFPNYFNMIPFAAFLGAVLSTILILALAHYTRGSKMTIVLSGIAISGFINAGINTLTLLYPEAVTSYNSFTIGGLSGILMEDLYIPLIIIFIAFILCVLFAGSLDVLSLGDDVAMSLGMRVKTVRILFVILAGALAGCVVSFAGLIGFVGLIVPHICRRMVGNESRRLIVASGLFGAVLMILSDLFGRMIFAPYELPVGIIMAFLGGPFFIMLLLKGRRH